MPAASSGLQASFEPIERRTVSAVIRDRLVEAIRSGQLLPGDAVPSERSLCEQFGVARTSVREAIQGLVTAGVLAAIGPRSPSGYPVSGSTSTIAR